MKKKTLRQQLREQATSELEILRNKVVDAVAKMMPHYLATQDLLTLASSTRNQSLKNKLVSKIANEKEAELLRLYNKQNDLPLGDKDADAKVRTD